MCLSAILSTVFKLKICHYKHVNWCTEYPLCGCLNVQTFGIEIKELSNVEFAHSFMS